MHLVAIEAKKIPYFWDRVIPLLQPAIEMSDGRYNKDVVYKGLRTSNMQLWAVEDGKEFAAACVTQIVSCETGLKVLRFLFCGGRDMREWLELIEPIKEWGRHHKCTRADIFGREGWVRALGWKKKMVLMEIEL